MNRKKINLHILGPQGSGKGTQAKILAQRFGLTLISVGDLFRERLETKDEFSLHLKKILDNGQLVPIGILERIIEEKILSNPDTVGFIFDSAIRDYEQMELFKSIWPKFNLDEPIIIVLDIPDKISIERIKKRRICNNCSFITSIDQTDGTDQCPRCLVGKLIQRTDDTKGTIENRLKIYHQETKKVIEYFTKENRIILIDGKPEIQTVTASIIKSLKNKLSIS